MPCDESDHTVFAFFTQNKRQKGLFRRLAMCAELSSVRKEACLNWRIKIRFEISAMDAIARL